MIAIYVRHINKIGFGTIVFSAFAVIVNEFKIIQLRNLIRVKE